MIDNAPEPEDALIDAIAETAGDWIDVDYGPRVEAEETTLTQANRFTPEALAFAVDQQMSLLTVENLLNWKNQLGTPSPSHVGVLNAGNIPFVGLQDFIAVLLAGCTYSGTVSSRSPYLLPAFAADVCSRVDDVSVSFIGFETLLKEADALIVSGSDETTAAVLDAAMDSGIERDRVLRRGHRFSIGVLDGRETEGDRLAFAEDMLLHEGQGCRNLSMLWAPADTDPNPYLDAMAKFRSVFPAHPSTTGSLKMQQAFLQAVDQPHAYADGPAFLLSKGTPEAQSPGHVRWVEYVDTSDVENWIKDHVGELQLVSASPRVRLSLPETVTRVDPGEAQRPELGWCQGEESVGSFFGRL